MQWKLVRILKATVNAAGKGIGGSWAKFFFHFNICFSPILSPFKIVNFVKICQNIAIFEPNFQRKNISYKNQLRKLKIGMHVQPMCLKNLIELFKKIELFCLLWSFKSKKIGEKSQNFDFRPPNVVKNEISNSLRG